MGATDDDILKVPAPDGLPVRLVTVNDVVSMNLAHFRKAAGLSQQELANQIGWLKQVVSTAERSWEGRRTRNFTVGDLIDIAGGLGIPLAALLLPPDDDGTAVTYVVDGLDGSGPQLLRDLVPMVMADSSSYDGESAVVKEFRRRLLAGKWHLDRPEAQQETGVEAGKGIRQATVRALEETIRTITEHAVAIAGGDPAIVERVEQETIDLLATAGPGVEFLLARRMELERRVDDLRTFEREYRNRLRQYLEDQYRAFWAGTEGVDPDQLLSAMRDKAIGRPHVITVPAAGAWGDKAPDDALMVMLPEEARQLGLAGARDLRSRGIPGPYMIGLEDDGSVTVTSAPTDESVRVEKEPAGEG
ncbi:MAG TPA: helix-turn-helix transcriptional regulator [Trebonia sp.]|jgi:transcriptional regulator with XRE-family HTH domain|nr:helix-turn-helix transcriptional regulator [Trebonia sp.]